MSSIDVSLTQEELDFVKSSLRAIAKGGDAEAAGRSASEPI